MLLLGDVINEFDVCNGKLFRRSTNLEAGGFRKDGYRVVSIFNKRYLTHRILYMIYHNLDYNNLPKVIDHINGDVTDNNLENLRACYNNKQNLYNCKSQGGKSKYKGVHLRVDGKKWCAQIMVDRKSIHLGSFKSEWEAAQAYNKAAKKYFGEYAWVNQ